MTATPADAYRRIATVLRQAQRIAIETENAPDQRKRLRSYSVPEVATLLGIETRDVIKLSHPVAARFGAARRMSFEDLGALRQALFENTKQPKFNPRRAPDRGEGLATIAFTNFKGGSAKTTSSVHFAQYMAREGYRVLMIDLDSQGSTTAQFGIDPASEVGAQNSFTGWLEARESGRAIAPRSIIQKTYWPTIDLIPAGAALAEGEELLNQRAARGQAEEVLYFEELSAFLKTIEADYDLVVVDTRPDVNMLMTIALHAATGLVVPARATMTDLASTGEFFDHLARYVDDFGSAFGAALPTQFTKIMVTAYDPTDRSQEALVALIRDRFGESVLPGEFLHSRIMGTAGFGKETLYEYEPTSDRAAYNRVITSANAINREIERLILAGWGRDLDGVAPSGEAAQ